jgi:hypothetical protein
MQRKDNTFPALFAIFPKPVFSSKVNLAK